MEEQFGSTGDGLSADESPASTDVPQISTDDATTTNESPPVGASFYPIRVDKFIVLSVLTLGFYELVWFYRNWRSIRAATEDSLLPFWRTIFAPLFYFNLIYRVRGTELGWGALLGIGYLLVQGANQLPDPFWLIESASFVFLLPVVTVINGRVPRGMWPASSLWRAQSAALAVAGVVVIVALGWSSSTREDIVIPAEYVPENERLFLEEAGILFPAEGLLYFYSAGMLSIEEEGVLASDQGVTYYWVDPFTEELQIAFVRYEEILNVEVARDGDQYDYTLVRLTDMAGNWLVFALSQKEEVDRDFIREIERRSSVQAMPMTNT